MKIFSNDNVNVNDDGNDIYIDIDSESGNGSGNNKGNDNASNNDNNHPGGGLVPLRIAELDSSRTITHLLQPNQDQTRSKLR